MFTTELQYVLVRYMLNELGDEAANVGLVAVTNDPPRVVVKFLPDPTVKSRSDARVKREAVERFASMIKREVTPFSATNAAKEQLTELVFKRLQDIGGNVVRITLPRSVLTNNARKEIDLLFSQLIAPSTGVAQRPRSSTRDPLRALRKKAATALIKKFREGYGRPLSRNQFTRSYEVRGATHKNVFDLAAISGPKNNRREHLFQHLLMLPDSEESFTQAAGLCWRWADIQASNHANRQLTAVIYEKGGRGARGVQDARKLLKRERISVTELSDLPSLVEKLKSQGRLF